MQDEFDAEPAASGGVSCLAWTTSPFDRAMLVVAGGSNTAKVWGYLPSRKWVAMLEFCGHTARINDVAWAPNVGRSYHFIATAGGDGKVALWKLVPDTSLDGLPSDKKVEEGAVATVSHSAVGSTWAAKRLPTAIASGSPVAAFDDHRALPVWRVEFNVTGTVLASSGDDGTLRLRRQNLAGMWETVAAMDTQTAAPGTAAGHGAPALSSTVAAMHAS